MNPAEVVWIDFPGVIQIKRRPAVILSSSTYHATRLRRHCRFGHQSDGEGELAN